MEVKISLPGIVRVVTPMPLMASPARPGRRSLRPCMSSSEWISFLNQPPIWVPVLPTAKGLRLCSA